MGETLLTRHIAASITEPDRCWPYPGYCNTRTGYGNATLDGRRVEAHRAAYELLIGPIPDGHEIDHLCRNRPCCNPWHLQPVPHRVNLLRGESPAALQAKQTHCVHGHELAGANLYTDRRGRRHCVECRRQRSRALYYQRTGRTEVPDVRPDYRTHCKYGHPKSGDNLYVGPSGQRACRTCQREAQRQYRQRQA